MSLKEAVGALRSLKAELEASRRSKAELEALHYDLIEELRIARLQASSKNGPDVNTTGNGRWKTKEASLNGGSSVVEEGGNESDGASPAVISEYERRQETLQDELLEARRAASAGKEEQKGLDEEIQRLREELAAAKEGAEERVAHVNRELQESLLVRDEAIGAGETAQGLVKEAQKEAAMQKARAEATGRELSGATEGADVLRARLDETVKELQSAQNALTATTARGKRDGGGKAEECDDEDMSELESELRSVREAVTGQSTNSSEAKGSAADTAAPMPSGTAETLMAAAAFSKQKANQLEEKLKSAVRENLEVQELLENVRGEQQRYVREKERESEAAATSAAAALSFLRVEKDGDISSLTDRLAHSEGALEDAEQAVSSLKRTLKEESAAALEGTRGEIAVLKATLADAMEAHEEVELLAASDRADKVEEISSLRGEVSRSLAELAKTTARAASQASEWKEAAAAAAVAAAEREDSANKAASSRIVELESALREAETDRRSLLEAAAKITAESQNREAGIEAAAAREAKGAAAAAADVAQAVTAKEAAEEEAREASSRASSAESSVLRLKAKVAELREGQAEAEGAAKVAKEERDAALAAVAEADKSRQDVEDTLLMANQELERLKKKYDEILPEADRLRVESERLTATVETLRAASAAAAAAVAAEEESSGTKISQKIQQGGKEEEEKKGGMETHAAEDGREETIARLKGIIEDLKLERAQAQAIEKPISGGTDGDGDGSGGRGTDSNRLKEFGQESRVRGDADTYEGKEEEERKRHAEGGDAVRTTPEVFRERDRLKVELRRAREKAAIRTAGLETQLADKEREAADTQRRLYRRQTELDTELEDLRSNHDALRIEMARMDASMQDVADAASSSTATSRGRGVSSSGGGGGVGKEEVARKDAAVVGAEMGETVGGILRGKFWSGWGAGGGGDGARKEELGEWRNVGYSSNTAAGKSGATSKSRRRGDGRGEGSGALGKGKNVPGGGVAVTAEDRAEVTKKRQKSLSRVRNNMMARIQEAASQPAHTDDGSPSKPRQRQQQEEKRPVPPGNILDADRDKESLADADGSPTSPLKMGEQNGGVEEEKGTGVNVSGVSASGGVIGNEWVEETAEHPAPDYGVDSPVIRYLLQQWSSDPDKLKYLSLWLRCVIERRKVPDAFPSGLQLVGLAPEIKDGFLTLVIPMIRFTGGLPVLVHSRRCSPEMPPVNGGGTPHIEELWDLRVKVAINSGATAPAPAPAPRGGQTGDGSRRRDDGGQRAVETAGAARRRRGGGSSRGSPGREGLAGRVESQLSKMQEGGRGVSGMEEEGPR